MYRLFLTLFLLGGSLLSADPMPTDQSQFAVKSAIDDLDIKTFAETVYAAGLKDLFVGTGPFTVVAPSNAAFENQGRHKWLLVFRGKCRQKQAGLGASGRVQDQITFRDR